ncbi:MAG: MBL fold metallo-hydrolase [Acidobacteria bacterium]|nr:MBL fold metallo-hydrolase [Acidobacteriota bacterium]MYJ04386.1 MBL fold metallo-hydrolase [Acidobacteriota bacterium]
MKRILVLGALVMAAGFSVAVNSEQQLTQAALDAAVIEQVRDNLYVITGSSPLNREAFSGGNTGVYVGAEGVTLVDTKLGGWGPALMERIRTVTDKPVTTIINTHTHGDHVGSNMFFPEEVEIVVHENTRLNMAGMDIFAGDGARGLPDRTYNDQLTLGSGADRIELYHFGPGHTSGDTFILYPGLRVLQMGDMFPWQDAPFLDRNNGGSGVEFPETLRKLLDNVDGFDTVIPGHIPVTTPDSLEEYQRFTADLLGAVREAIADGQTAEQAAASIDLTSQYEGYRTERMAAAIQAIYEELGQ